MNITLGGLFGSLGKSLTSPADQTPPPDAADQFGAVPATAQPGPEFATSLKLDPEREKAMVSKALARAEELKRDMGLGTMGEVQPGSWMDRRRRNELSYAGDYTWRLAMGGIFSKSNFTCGSGIRHVRYLSARVQDDLLGTEPFFACIANAPDKQDLAKQVEDAVQRVVDRSKTVRAGLREGQKIALIRNECVLKTSWLRRATPFTGPATVLVEANGEPVTTPEKELYIFKDDDMLPSPTVEGAAVLVKDPSFSAFPNPQDPSSMVLPAQDGIAARPVTFELVPDLEQESVQFEGVHVGCLDYRSFLCPLDVESVHDADTVVHLFQRSPNELRAQFQGFDVGTAYFSWFDAPGEQQPKVEKGEIPEMPSLVYRRITIAEVYMRCNPHEGGPDDDGRDKEVMMVLDVKNKKAIYYNYLANHMPRRPFEVIPGVEREPNRWYGRGIYGILEDFYLFEDAQFNRANFKQSKNASIRFAHKGAVDEWDAGLAPVIGDERINYLKSSFDPTKGPPIFDVNLYENMQPELELLTTGRQSADSILGSISSKDASVADLNQSKTAYGIANLQQASDVITKATEQDQTDAIEAVMEQVVDVILENLDHTALMLNRDATELLTLNRDEARAMPRDIKLLLTRSRSTQLTQTSAEAIDIVKDFGAVMVQDIRSARRWRPLYISQLKGLEVPDADELCPEITDEMIAQADAAQAQQAQLAAAAQQAKQLPPKASQS